MALSIEKKEELYTDVISQLNDALRNVNKFAKQARALRLTVEVTDKIFSKQAQRILATTEDCLGAAMRTYELLVEQERDLWEMLDADVQSKYLIEHNEIEPCAVLVVSNCYQKCL